ncbi:MAG TPA: hypothetical protein VMG60_12585 [Burkholderiaceae bacterium]|nr:hypothetical protein [Burkholderiaceae bacterium]
MTGSLDGKTYVYRVLDGCVVRLDVYGAEIGATEPAVVWILGGGLIFRTRTTPRPTFLAALLAAGAVVVSIDHRLAPGTSWPTSSMTLAPHGAGPEHPFGGEQAGFNVDD